MFKCEDLLYNAVNVGACEGLYIDYDRIKLSWLKNGC